MPFTPPHNRVLNLAIISMLVVSCAEASAAEAPIALAPVGVTINTNTPPPTARVSVDHRFAGLTSGGSMIEMTP